MTGPRTKAVIASGIVDDDALLQLQKWGLPIDLGENIEPLLSAVGIANAMLDAVTSEDAVELRSTDLDIVRNYLDNRQRGRLHVPNPEAPGKTVGISVDYCVTTMGEVVIPWTSEGISDSLLDPESYLKPIGRDRIYFEDIRELFHGEHKAFLVCVPAKGA